MTKTKSTFVVAAAMAGMSAGVAMMAAGCQPKNKSADSGMQNNAGTMSTDSSTADKHDCKGMNNCKGQGGCKTGDNGCKGKNSCKGKGGCKSAMPTP
ncbi:MAG TPA: hypothetical protein VFC78_12870 [Tepidisphaeraceae bacterium]|nr:hypothetical protein [Tepidisphaeraceae bacterium]